MIKAREGFILQKMMDSYMIIAVGEAAQTFSSIIQTNDTGAFYWGLIEKGTTEDALVQAAMARFEDLEESVARKDIAEFLACIAPAINRY